MFRAFLVFAVEDFSKVPQIEEALRKDFKGIVRTTKNPEETKHLLQTREAEAGFVEWKNISEPEFNLAVSEIHLNVNPYHVEWGITFHMLNDKFGIEWARWCK